jgi:hypothetical protein
MLLEQMPVLRRQFPEDLSRHREPGRVHDRPQIDAVPVNVSSSRDHAAGDHTSIVFYNGFAPEAPRAQPGFAFLLQPHMVRTPSSVRSAGKAGSPASLIVFTNHPPTLLIRSISARWLKSIFDDPTLIFSVK